MSNSEINIDILVGHTVRITKITEEAWIVTCLTCKSINETFTSEKKAYQMMGFHFGRLSTEQIPFGVITGEKI